MSIPSTESVESKESKESVKSVVQVAQTKQWLEAAVIGLNLCPFAKAPYSKNKIRFVVSHAKDERSLLHTLEQELKRLRDTPIDEIETILIIHPEVLRDFFDYNDFLSLAEALLTEHALDGEIQIASFHPDYQFGGTQKEDPTNNTNRSPYPMLHLLREDSIDRALESDQTADAIIERNTTTMRNLGQAGWLKLMNPKI
jgi:uncharacterized protein